MRTPNLFHTSSVSSAGALPDSSEPNRPSESDKKKVGFAKWSDQKVLGIFAGSAAIGVTVAVAAPILIPAAVVALCFGSGGIAAGSTGAWLMALGQGEVDFNSIETVLSRSGPSCRVCHAECRSYWADFYCNGSCNRSSDRRSHRCYYDGEELEKKGRQICKKGLNRFSLPREQAKLGRRCSL